MSLDQLLIASVPVHSIYMGNSPGDPAGGEEIFPKGPKAVY